MSVKYFPPRSARFIDAVAKWATADIAWLLFVLGVSLLARLMHIERQPFWLDEVFTFQRVHLGTGSLIADSYANRHMPSYFLLLQWLSQFDPANAMLRIPSALFGALSACMVFVIARRVSGRSAAVVAGLLMALSPLQVQYGQEARSYTLVILLITVALWGLVRLAQDPARASLNIRSRHFDWCGWTCYVFGTLGALDVLADAAPWLIATNASLFFIWRGLRSGQSVDASTGFLRNWLLSLIVIVACCLPFYAAILAASDGQMLHQYDWIPPLSWQTLKVVAKSAYLMRMADVVRFSVLPTAVPLLGLMVALLAALGLWRLRGRLEGRVLLLGFAVLPLLLLAFSPIKSMVLPRYILWSAAPFFVLAGSGAGALPRRILPAVVTVLLLVCAVNLAPVYRIETKPRWDKAAATLNANVRPGDTVFTGDPNAPTMLSVLHPEGAAPIQDTALVTTQLDVAIARWKQGSRVWAVNGRSALGQREDLDAFEERIAALGVPALQIPEGKEITILMFPAPSDTD